jgi:hypothetical protein
MTIIGPGDEFVCTRCGETFLNVRSDVEAWAEAQQQFPGLREEDSTTVCEDCYPEYLAQGRREGWWQ